MVRWSGVAFNLPPVWLASMRRFIAPISCLVFLGMATSASSQDAASSSAVSTITDAAEQIDLQISRAWEGHEVTPAEQSSDAEFCRRVWLDLAGVAPPVAEARAFLDDDTVDKRSVLIDRLLASPYHARHMAATWNDILLPADAQSIQQRGNVAALESWLRDQFASNTPYDYFVASFLTAGGAADRGPAIFYTTRDVEPKKIAAATSRIFLGIQLQCAECHDHPFDRWTQEDFWGYAAFFAQLQRADENNGDGGFITDQSDREVTLPDSDQTVAPHYPGASEPPEVDVTNHRRRQLTIWLASRDNRYFARAAVNRVWGQLFGRGLVDPVDAMDKDNPASHPELLKFLTDYFVQHRFDLRKLLATVTRSQAYQRSSAFAGDTRPDEGLLAVMNIKTLTAAQYYDSIRQNVLRQPSDFATDQTDPRREQFLARMKAADSLPSEYPHGVMQVLGVMNGPEISQAIDGQQSGLLASLEAPFFSDQDKVEAIFLAALSRRPTAAEQKRVAKFFNKDDSSTTSLQLQSDLLWTLLNTAEATVCP